MVEAAHFAEGEVRQIAASSAPLRRRPALDAPLENEVLFGERVRVFDEADGWAWVQLEHDDYVGYVRSDALRREIFPTTHRVSSLGTFVFPSPDIKTIPLIALSMNAGISVDGEHEGFMRLATGGWVAGRHVTEAGHHADDFVAVAERFIGTPYLWGGRTRLGLDCSGLLQIALEAAGQDAPRDSDMQEAALGAPVQFASKLEGLERGDLVFWPRHVGIMADSGTLLHANAHHMAVVTEPLRAVVERVARTGANISAIKRLTARSGADKARSDDPASRNPRDE